MLSLSTWLVMVGMIDENGELPVSPWCGCTFWYQIEPFKSSEYRYHSSQGLMSDLAKLWLLAGTFLPGIHLLPRWVRSTG